jgi:hypothetical protein
MSNCCSNHATKIVGETCPKCKTACKSVELKTLYHQVRFPENTTLGSDKYYFCSSKECSIGYFSSSGQIIPKSYLRTYQEIKNDKLCYCFDIDAAHYLSALNANDADALKNFVIEKTKSGDCACEVKNPSGQCCLAKFKTLASAGGAST